LKYLVGPLLKAAILGSAYLRSGWAAFFPPIFLSSNSFIFYPFFSKFAQEYSILLRIYKYLLLNLKHSSMCDCSVRVFYNMVTALLGYLDL